MAVEKKGEINMEKIKKIFLEHKKISIYYIIIIIFVIIGFIVGNRTYESDSGYFVFYGEPYNHYIGGVNLGKRTDNVEIGDNSITKYNGFYFLTFTSKKTYFNGETELTQDDIMDMAEAEVPLTYSFEARLEVADDTDSFRVQIYWVNIILTILLIAILIIAPFILPKLKNKIKSLNSNRTNKKKLKNLNELEEMKKAGIITSDEYEAKKKKILG